MQKIREEKEAYEEAFNKLSNEEKKIINDVEIKINSKVILMNIGFWLMKIESLSYLYLPFRLN